MKININIDSRFAETEITINCGYMNEELEKAIAALRVLGLKPTGVKNNQTYLLDAPKILYNRNSRQKNIPVHKNGCLRNNSIALRAGRFAVGK